MFYVEPYNREFQVKPLWEANSPNYVLNVIMTYNIWPIIICQCLTTNSMCGPSPKFCHKVGGHMIV